VVYRLQGAGTATCTCRTAVWNQWTGILDWNTGLEYWTGILDWNTGMEYWTGILEWPKLL